MSIYIARRLSPSPFHQPCTPCSSSCSSLASKSLGVSSPWPTAPGEIRSHERPRRGGKDLRFYKNPRRRPNGSFYAESTFGSHELWIPEGSGQISRYPRSRSVVSRLLTRTGFFLRTVGSELNHETTRRRSSDPVRGRSAVRTSDPFMFFGSKYLHYGCDRTGEL
jgi:hypothetical protein